MNPVWEGRSEASWSNISFYYNNKIIHQIRESIFYFHTLSSAGNHLVRVVISESGLFQAKLSFDYIHISFVITEMVRTWMNYWRDRQT